MGVAVGLGVGVAVGLGVGVAVGLGVGVAVGLGVGVAVGLGVGVAVGLGLTVSLAARLQTVPYLFETQHRYSFPESARVGEKDRLSPAPAAASVQVLPPSVLCSHR